MGTVLLTIQTPYKEALGAADRGELRADNPTSIRTLRNLERKYHTIAPNAPNLKRHLLNPEYCIFIFMPRSPVAQPTSSYRSSRQHPTLGVRM